MSAVEPFFDEDDLEEFREMKASAFPDLCTIYAPPDPDNPTTDDDGNIDRSFPSAWSVVASSVPCRVELSRLRAGERVGPGIPVGTAHNIIQLPYDTVVRQTYRIKITASTFQPQLVGIVFDVIDDAMTSYADARTVEVQRKDIDE